MKRLQGVLDRSLGNFWCLRGYARMGELYKYSDPDESIQRDLLSEHRDEMVEFLSGGDFLFFPEVILGLVLSPDDGDLGKVNEVFQALSKGEGFRNVNFGKFSIRSSVTTLKSTEDTRAEEYFHRATIEVSDKSDLKLLSRIDGNHRLSATPEDAKFSDYNSPYCIVLFRDETEAKRYSRALFHNINYKQVPLTMEQNLKLILGDAELFSDDDLKKPPFGWAYYLARKLYGKLDFEILTQLELFLEKEPRTFLLRQLEFLIREGVLRENEHAIKRFKKALGVINGQLSQHSALSECENPGFLGALLYYALRPTQHTAPFIRWVLVNHLHLIPKSHAADFINIFNNILESKARTIFVSMPYGKDETEDHYRTIERVCQEISSDYDLKPALKAQRVDWFNDGTSYAIDDKIIEMIAGCGLLIGDLTFGNVNVYNEIGFLMGKAHVEGLNTTNMLLILDESVGDGDKTVGFNLQGIKQLRFKQSNQLADKLRENLELFFVLQSNE